MVKRDRPVSLIPGIRTWENESRWRIPLRQGVAGSQRSTNQDAQAPGPSCSGGRGGQGSPNAGPFAIDILVVCCILGNVGQRGPGGNSSALPGRLP